MHPIVLIGIVLISMAITLGLAVLGVRRRNAPGAVPFSALMLLITVWSFISLVIFLLPGPGYLVFFLKMKYLCIAFVPVAWIAYAMAFTGRTLSLRWLGILLIVPLTLQSIHWIGSGTWNSNSELVKWFWVHASYSFFLAFAGTALLSLNIVGSASLYRWQAVPLLIGALSPLMLNLLYTFNIIPMVGMDFSFLSFAVFGLAFAWSMFRYDLFKLVPVAREMLFDNMNDALVVVDSHPNRHVLDINPAACDLFDVGFDNVLGQPLDHIEPSLVDFLPTDHMESRESGDSKLQLPQKDISFQRGTDTRFYDALVSRISKSRKRLGGYLIVLRDVTERKLSQRALSQAMIREAKLEAQASEARAQAAEAEAKRKTQELEEARRLQLSMLPQDLPNLNWVDVAVSMKTAHEVGGDYYDFHVPDPNRLLLAIGDATGHGLRAGTLVTMTKALFNFEMPIDDPIGFFRQYTRAIKGQAIGNLYMSLSILDVNRRRLNLTSAGMPPAYVVRRGTAHQVISKGLPLGADPGFPYYTATFDVQSGDLIVLLTDGFPELFNRDKQMLGYDSVGNLLEEFPNLSPQSLIDRFHERAVDWLGDAVQADDMTFVVLKIAGK